jgi:hypothetical protein
VIAARAIAKAIFTGVLRDVLIGMLFATIVLVPAYLAYLRGYDDGDHDRVRFEREHAVGVYEDCDARLAERGEHDTEWFTAQCNQRVDTLSRVHWVHADAGARRR